MAVTYVVNNATGGNRKSNASLFDPVGIQEYGTTNQNNSPTVAGISSRDSRLRGSIYPGSNTGPTNSKMGG